MNFDRAHSKINATETRTRATIRLNTDSVMVIRLPDSRILRIISRSLLMAVFILAWPSVSSMVRIASSGNKLAEQYPSTVLARPYGLVRFESLPMVFKDLVDEGLLKNGQKGLLLTSGIVDLFDNLWFLNSKGINFVIDSDFDRQMGIPDEAFDFVFTPSLESIDFINRVVKFDGIVVMPLGNLYDTSYEYMKRLHYKIVYLRQFDSNTVIAMRKVDSVVNSQRKHKVCGGKQDAKREALNGLEGVLLEPPNPALVKQRINEGIKYFSELLGDLYESYKRRIFITDEKDGVLDWFYEKYPKRNHVFEVYDLEKEIDVKEKLLDGSISKWLVKNVREEDYVVMKAEAGLVKEMLEEKTVCLLDELFLECNNQRKKEKKIRKRAYWECVELYGKLKDEGVAVHQWWG